MAYKGKHTKYIQHYVKLLLYSLSNGEIWTWVFLNYSWTRTWLSHIHNSLQLGWSGRLSGRHGFHSKHGSLNENHSGSLQLFKRWLLGERRRATLPHHYDSVGRISAGRHAASRPCFIPLVACRLIRMQRQFCLCDLDVPVKWNTYEKGSRPILHFELVLSDEMIFPCS